jgi:hypothetical protein
LKTLPTLGFDLLIPQGVDWPGINYPIFGADGSPYDLTGCSARAEIRPFAGSDELYFAWSTTPAGAEGAITLGSGVINLRVLGAESAPWSFTSAEYDIVLFNPAAPIGVQRSRVAMGAVTVSRMVTSS